MKCCIVKDLLPGYIDGLTSKETNVEIEKHLSDCVECHIIYEQMSTEIPDEIKSEEKEIDFLKKWKVSIRHRYVIVMLSTCVLLMGLSVALTKYHLPVPYDPDRMTTGIYQTASVPGQYGLKEWRDLNTLDLETMEAVNSGKYDTREEVRLVLKKSVKSDDLTSYGRTIQRDGETVRVIYYCYTRTLWSSLFPDGSNFVDHSVAQGAVYGTDLTRNASMDHQPEMREIYYLPMGNMNRLDRLSDEEFDAKRKEATLVWSGVN